MRRALAAAALMLACNGPITEVDPCGAPLQPGEPIQGGAAPRPPPVSVPLNRVGQAITVSVSDFERQADQCKAGETFQSFTAEVLDPNLAPLDATITTSRNAQVTLATVAFTPSAPGWYHLTASFKFDTRTSTLQRDFLVVADRTAAAVAELPRTCMTVARTTRGAWVCDNVVLRDGALVETLAGETFETSGDTVWGVGGGTLTRYTDTGTGLLARAGNQSLNIGGSSQVRLLASADEVVVASTVRVARYRVDGTGALVASGEVSFPTSLSTLPWLGRSGQTLWVAGTGTSSGTSFCPYTIGETTLARTANACTQSTARTLAASGEGFWIWSGGVLRELRMGAAELEPGSWLSVANDYAPDQAVNPPRQAPFVSVNQFFSQQDTGTEEQAPWYLPELVGGKTALAQYEKRPGYDFQGASPTLAWETHPETGRTVVFTR